ncbi:MAG: hypothetical protein IIA09_13175 [Proteobacteria bacterium]|nr:hypothetical protein [Pseudomonadota bacterium]
MDVRGGEPIFKGNDCIGVTTSGGFGHFVQKSLGCDYVDPANERLSVDTPHPPCKNPNLF